MSTPQPPEPGGRAWSESSPTEHGPIGNPPTQEFSAQEQYPGQPYSEQQYLDQHFQGQQYSDQQYPDQQYPDQQYAGQYYAQQPPPPNYGAPGYAPPPSNRTPAWAWVLLGLVIVGLLGGVGYLAVSQFGGGGDSPAASSQSAGAHSTAPNAVTPSPRPTTSAAPTTAPQAGLPSNASPCAANQRTAEFSSSAVVGNTSCPFAEEVRMAYLQQPQRGSVVTVQAWSPITKQMYAMTCSGVDVVKCAGGNNAVVYVY